MGPEGLGRRRDTALQALGEHYARGHLSTGTMERRIGALLGAESRHAMSAAVGDLPSGGLRGRADRALDALRGPVAVSFADEVTLVLSSELERREWVVGRSRGCDVRVADTTVSARHARLVRRGGVWSVHDLGSTNGTWVNGARVDFAVLRPGDALRLGGLSGRVSR